MFDPEQIPLRQWEEVKDRCIGALTAPLSLPVNLEPSESLSGYLAFYLDERHIDLAKDTAEKGNKNAFFQVEDLATGRTKDFDVGTLFV